MSKVSKTKGICSGCRVQNTSWTVEAPQEAEAMTAFLMTWKETNWPHENLVRLVDKFKQQCPLEGTWRIKAHKRAIPGDRVWIMKQGKGPKGIFGAGHIIGEPALGEPGDGTTKMMVPVSLEALVDPLERFLIDEASLLRVLRPSQVGARASGYPIDDEQSTAFEGLFTK